eukprot:767338_1
MEGLMMLCDYCDDGYHTYMYCVGLSAIPKNDWYCSTCDFVNTNNRNKKKKHWLHLGRACTTTNGSSESNINHPTRTYTWQSEDKIEKWSCDLCQYKNESARTKCQMCNKLKQKRY